jgi:hypothetical protein
MQKCNGSRPECSPCANHQRKCSYGVVVDETLRLQKRVRELEAQLRRGQRGARSVASKTRTHKRADYAEAAQQTLSSASPTTHTPISDYPAPAQNPGLTLTPWHPPMLGGLIDPSNGLFSWDPSTDMPRSLRSDMCVGIVR